MEGKRNTATISQSSLKIPYCLHHSFRCKNFRILRSNALAKDFFQKFLLRNTPPHAAPVPAVHSLMLKGFLSTISYEMRPYGFTTSIYRVSNCSAACVTYEKSVAFVQIYIWTQCGAVKRGSFGLSKKLELFSLISVRIAAVMVIFFCFI